MAWCSTFDCAGRRHSAAAVSSAVACHHLVGTLGAVGLEKCAQGDNRILPALLRIRVLALSRTFVAGTTGGNHWGGGVRDSSDGDPRTRKAVASEVGRTQEGATRWRMIGLSA